MITGAAVTAAGRFFELVMMTGATIAGVALVLHLASRFGAPFVAISADAPPALAAAFGGAAGGLSVAWSYDARRMPRFSSNSRSDSDRPPQMP